ncbi:tafazzin, phospholipid-lysophospholipid transacylase isoform X2 [Arctopsyche grandis]|uniref:tafazzin, phospholipid-lysophospholipid transacylase isoform X2 n=1 Tax=Arctopsyche grandis TaxID=121162 RepID=UPI00406D9BE6
MCPDVGWVVPKLRRPALLWNVASSFTIVIIGLITKAFIVWLNKTTVINKQILTKALDHRPQDVPLITVSNHHSCFDDPGMWGTIPFRHLCSRRSLRWSLAAHDICFTNVAHSIFFMLGKCIPVIRGKGVYQPAMDFCVEKLKEGGWVHIFPEGKVNATKEPMRLKWGIGRLIYESPITPVVIPIWHEGMDDILPNAEPYVLRFKKKLTINYGEPLHLEDIVNKLKEANASPEEARKTITDYIQVQLQELRHKTRQIIEENSNNNIKKES